MGMLWQDLRYAFRMLAKSPGFAAVAVLTLALGIGANTAIFSIVDGVVLRPLPYPNQSQLVFIWETDANRKLMRGTAPPADFLDWRRQNHVFQQIAAWKTRFYNLTGAGAPEQVWGGNVSANFFDLLGVKPALGRSFSPDEEQPGHDRVVILSHGLWVRRYGANPSLIGRTITVDDNPFTVIGVLPRDFNFFGLSRPFELWMPLAFEPQQIRRDNPQLLVFGRLKNGVTVAQAQAEMSAIASRLAAEYPQTNEGTGVFVASLQHELQRGQGDALLRLLGAVGVVLLIACANVANLLLSRATVRQREVAIRAALGAKRLRLIRQLLTESILLGLLGGAAGLLLAYGALRLLPAILPPAGGFGELPHANWIHINLPVLGFTILVAILTGIIFGLAPAFHLSKTNLSESLKESGRSSTGGLHSQFTRSLLVVTEVALSLVLLLGAGILIRSFRDLLEANPGLNPRNVLSLQIWLPESHYPAVPQVRSFFQQVIDEVRALPGVESASAINFLPLSGWTDFADFDIEGRPAPLPGQQPTGHYRIIDPDYFRTMQIPLLRGRFFTQSDGEQAPGVAIINQTLAEQYWPGQDPVGQRIRMHLAASKSLPWRTAAPDTWLTIVGIAGDVQERELGGRKWGEIYLSYLQDPSRVMRLVVRTGAPPLVLADAVRHAVLRVDKNQPVTSIKTMEQYLSEALSSQKLDATLAGFFAGLALILAAVGIYGVISYSVEQRTHEIGIRMALGAQPRNVFSLIVFGGMRLTLLGILIGLAAAWILARIAAGLLFGIKSIDPLTAAEVVGVLLGAAFVACYIPARRATRVDPIRALRYE